MFLVLSLPNSTTRNKRYLRNSFGCESSITSELNSHRRNLSWKEYIGRSYILGCRSFDRDLLQFQSFILFSSSFLRNMRIACLQFNPELGRLAENVAHANSLLEAASPQNIDLLVLPELAFAGIASSASFPMPTYVHSIDHKTGYNYPSLASILPHLEPTISGPSTTWAKVTASRLNCIVTVGYPELYTPPPAPSTNTQDLSSAEEFIAYNSTVTVSPTGLVLAHYRKTHLYYTDETWAKESPSGWLSTSLAFAPKTRPERIVQANFGICMDLNPHKFEAPWEAYEFAAHALASGSELLVLSMAWLTGLNASELASYPEEPDLSTLSYWAERLKPLVEAEKEVIAVFANRVRYFEIPNYTFTKTNGSWDMYQEALVEGVRRLDIPLH